MGVLFRLISFKKKKQFLIEDNDCVEKYEISGVTLDVAVGALVFFWNLKSELLKTTLNYLATQEEVELPQQMRDSLQNGAGINLSTDLLTGTFLNTIVSQNQNYTPV